MISLKRSIIIIQCTVPFIGLLLSCGHSAGEIAEIVSERDSLRTEIKRQDRRLQNLDEIVSLVNESLDSITTAEGKIFNSGTIEGGPATKEQVINNVRILENLISSQKRRISELEKNLALQVEEEGETKADKNIAGLIASLKTQIAQKDAEIARLKNELDKKSVDIAQLRQRTEAQSRIIVELDHRAKLQHDALKRQDAALNQCYMVIASKKELEKRGIIKKGRLIAQNALDRSKFAKVDIRKLREISFSARKPKLLTTMPESSYELTTDGNQNYTMKITNPTAFWSISNYLVIQTN